MPPSAVLVTANALRDHCQALARKYSGPMSGLSLDAALEDLKVIKECVTICNEVGAKISTFRARLAAEARESEVRSWISALSDPPSEAETIEFIKYDIPYSVLNSGDTTLLRYYVGYASKNNNLDLSWALEFLQKHKVLD